ncbi:MAG: lysoplasmalogenase family protein [Candidatus Enteromonas sp.]
MAMAVFLVADAYLVKTLFYRDDKRRDFTIMFTYLLAQGLIALGFCFIL